MSAAAEVVEPAGGDVAAYHDRKYRIFHRMFGDQLDYAEMMK